MDSAMTHLQAARAVGEDFVDRNPVFCQSKHMRGLEAKFGGSRASWFLGIFAFATGSLYAIGGLSLIVNLIGFLYPASASFKAIDSPQALGSKQWLSYWAIFGAFFTFENAFSYVVATFRWYSVMKGVTFIYSFHPSTRGASALYDSIIAPVIVTRVLPASSTRQTGKPSVADAAASAASAASTAATSAGVSASGQESTERGGPAVAYPSVKELITPDQAELRVVVVSASDVVPTDAPGAGVDCDPYCVLELLPEGSRAKDGAAEMTKYKTGCKTGTANPIWNEGVTIPNVAHLDAKLVVTVCNKRAMGRDQCLGKIEVPLSEVEGHDEPVDKVVDLMAAEDATEPPSGDLRVTLRLS